MAFTGNYVCNSFKRELFEGVHDFTATPAGYNLALYVSTATLDASTTAYTTSGEVADADYTAGGQAITAAAPTLSGSTVIIDFSNATWSTATITARGSLVYANYLVGDNAIAVNDFGEDKISSGGDFVVNFPTADASNAWLRLT